MKSRLTLNLVLLTVIAALGAVAFFKPGKQEPVSHPLLTLDTNALTRLTLQNKETLVFDKKDGPWRLTAPFAAPVNQIRIGQLLEVAKAKSEADYPLKPQDLAQFGLDKPQASLTLGDTALEFGGTDPINLRRYVKLGDTLHLVEDNFFHHLTAPATDYVEKKLLPEGAKIREIQIPGLKAVKNPEGQWTAEPASDGEGKTDLGELASAWATARAIEVKRNVEPVVGESIRIGLTEGAPIEFVILNKAPELILLRKDWGLQYEITSETSQELLNQPPPAPAKPDAAKDDTGKPSGPDHDVEDPDHDDDDEPEGQEDAHED